MAEKNLQRVYNQIGEIAQKYRAQKVVLFGSRARGTEREKSDIDIAVYGCNNFTELYLEMEEELWTLLELDIINMDEIQSDSKLIDEIEREGVIIYGQI